MKQSREAGRHLTSGSVFSVTVSKGPDMEEIVELPDFEEMGGQAIRTWRLDYQMLAINIREEASEEIDQHGVIRIDVPNDVDVENFGRSDVLNIYLSTGPETVELTNFRTKNREQVESWMEDNPLATVEFEYEASETVVREMVLRQSHAPNATLPSDETLTITLSGGPSVIVPNFSNGIFEEIQEEIPEGLTVLHRTRLHATVPYGRVIYQSVEAGKEVFGDDATVTVTTSLGRPWISDLVGQTEGELSKFFFDNFISNGANITFGVEYVDSFEPRGQVVSHSRVGQFLGMTDSVTVRISRGNLTPPEPDMGDAGE
jgi:serine/threonine-protein kinase